ncbi:ChaB family protein [Lyngbya sp. CCY1209]|uniref:ChaB family protein n=1 Tax=Lyngbya sp. CCY1209 TaxID=2886103 RepID=UPI002D20127A|nr:ChaB family protein [Lyngbya sp. CCY1209]MEB3883641.1 ChaB family protein [Lyngbya sp. CCY1209]
MPYETIQELPEELKQQLPQGAQQIFRAAFNSAYSDGISEDGARQIAWNSLKSQYHEGEDGKWYVNPEGGAGNSQTGTMPAS